jgi:hypothetical protein
MSNSNIFAVFHNYNFYYFEKNLDPKQLLWLFVTIIAKKSGSPAHAGGRNPGSSSAPYMPGSALASGVVTLKNFGNVPKFSKNNTRKYYKIFLKKTR